MSEEAGEDAYSDCFYKSYEEKIRASREEIYGLEITESQEYGQYMPDIPENQRDKYVMYRVRPVTNASEGDVDIDVRVVGVTGLDVDESILTIQDGNDMYVALSADEHGTMQVEAKLKDLEKVTNWVQIEY